MKVGSRIWTSAGLVCALTMATPVAAQTCLALPELDDFHAVVVSGMTGFFDGGHTFSGWGTFGGDVFAVAGYHYTDLTGSDEASKSLEGGLGITAVRQGGVSACLLTTVGYGLGLADGVSSYDLVPAVAVAYDDLLPNSPLNLVPALRFGAVYTSYSVESASELDFNQTDSFIEIGAGLVGPGGRWGIRPSLLLLSTGGDTGKVFRINVSLAGGT